MVNQQQPDLKFSMTEQTPDEKDKAESIPSPGPGKKKKVKKERSGSTSETNTKVSGGCHYSSCAHIYAVGGTAVLQYLQQQPCLTAINRAYCCTYVDCIKVPSGITCPTKRLVVASSLHVGQLMIGSRIDHDLQQ